MAPEVCQGMVYDYKADVWSLGCVLHELCSLKQPWKADNFLAVSPDWT
jgi:NIMA (never in mitosis gene a)-related kinase